LRGAAVHPLAVALLLALYVVAPQDNGPLAVIQIVVPHLALVGLVLVPFAFLRGARALRVGLVLLLIAFVIGLGDEWLSLPATPSGGGSLRVATWNLEIESRSPAESVSWLRSETADVVALVELSQNTAVAIDGDTVLRAAFPYRELHPGSGVTGLGVLSRYPITGSDYATDPAREEVTLDANGSTVTIVAAHPLHGDIRFLGRIPIDVDTTKRNADLELISDRIGELVNEGRKVVLMGDFNTAPTEPAFRRFTAGLKDAHRAVGIGPGWTWRPSRLEWLGIGLLRIDLVLAGSGLTPVSTTSRCPPVGDHCLLEAILTIDD
jgi:vancomycin resistance protein VanJ